MCLALAYILNVRHMMRPEDSPRKKQPVRSPKNSSSISERLGRIRK